MPQRLMDAVARFTQAILNPFDLDDLLTRLLREATQTLPAAGAAILLHEEQGGLTATAVSSERIAELEKGAHTLDGGVCARAFTTDETVVVEDLAADPERWPTYAGRATEMGIRAVVAVPLQAWGQTIGVLGVYEPEPTRWTAADLEACQILAAMGAGYILNATRTRAQHELAEQLQNALASRGVIERAKGIIMSEMDVDADTAFDLLREASMDRNQKVRDIAAEVVELGWRADAGDEPQPSG